MAKLIYTAITSLDGYVADNDGAFDWSVPDAQVHAFVNDLERQAGTYVYGRRMYDVMVAWENLPDLEQQPAYVRDYAQIWRAADKVVYSTTIDRPKSTRTRVERYFDPAVLRFMVDTATRDITIGGPELAAHAFRSGLVDECHLFVSPVVVGGGKPAFADGHRMGLELLAQNRFANGVVHLHYRVTPHGDHA